MSAAPGRAFNTVLSIDLQKKLRTLVYEKKRFFVHLSRYFFKALRDVALDDQRDARYSKSVLGNLLIIFSNAFTWNNSARLFWFYGSERKRSTRTSTTHNRGFRADQNGKRKRQRVKSESTPKIMSCSRNSSARLQTKSNEKKDAFSRTQPKDDWRLSVEIRKLFRIDENILYSLA